MSVARKKKKRVLLIVETWRSFGRRVVQGVSQYAREKGTQEFFFIDRENFRRYPQQLDDWDGDGIVSRCDNAEQCRLLAEKGLPWVELEGDGKDYKADVRVDEKHNCRLIVDHFLLKGFCEFGFFSLGSNWWSRGRGEQFAQALKTRGKTCSFAPQTRILLEDISLPLIWRKGCEDEIAAWVASLPKPVAIYCPWDMHAFFLMNVCASRGFSIPREVAVLGYGDNYDLCRHSFPTLSSLDPNGRRVGYEGAKLLDALMNGEERPKAPIYVGAERLVSRGSTDRIVAADPQVALVLKTLAQKDFSTISVNELAERTSISKRSLERLCRDAFGYSPKEAIDKARLEGIKELLLETDYPMQKIARIARFSSPANFGRFFRSAQDESPQMFRKRNRMAQTE